MPADYINMAGGPTELGRSGALSIESDPETHQKVDHNGPLSAGIRIRVPERRSYTITTILAPLTSATAFIISILALARRG